MMSPEVGYPLVGLGVLIGVSGVCHLLAAIFGVEPGDAFVGLCELVFGVPMVLWIMYWVCRLLGGIVMQAWH